MRVFISCPPGTFGTMTDTVWEEFRRTRVQITVPGGTLDIVPAGDATPGPYLPGATGPVHIVTAQNPMGLAAPEEVNTQAHQHLTIELELLDGVTVWPATGYGGGPLDAPGTWSEQGFALQGLDDGTALELAGRFDQRAIFIWQNEPGGFRLVACDGSVDESRGWTATFTPSP